MSSVRPSPESHSPPAGPFGGQSLALLIVVVVVVVFVVVGFTVACLGRYIFQFLSCCCRRRPPPAAAESAHSPSARRGLDARLISAFPTFSYASAASFPASIPWTLPGRNGRECAVCLAEFSKGDVLRLLTGCYHVFHQDCIDLWLMNNTTCPVCRLQLDPDYKPPPEESSPEPESDDQQEGSAVHLVLGVLPRPSLDRRSHGLSSDIESGSNQVTTERRSVTSGGDDHGRV